MREKVEYFTADYRDGECISAAKCIKQGIRHHR